MTLGMYLSAGEEIICKSRRYCCQAIEMDSSSINSDSISELSISMPAKSYIMKMYCPWCIPYWDILPRAKKLRNS